ncbi:MAG: hypothetical protein EOP81_19455 [Variovorax sp.]|nr:MAG: hypothetical protein EOP81_19455 [Variovorax sp.]
MNALSSPSFALRRQRDGLRQKQFSLSRPRGLGHSPMSADMATGIAPECVVKRLPAIGDTPALHKQRW